MQSRLGRTSVAAVIAFAGVVASACGDDPADPTSKFDAGTGGSGNGVDGSVDSNVLGGGEDDASFGNLDDARDLMAAGAQVKFFYSNHAKLVLSDDASTLLGGILVGDQINISIELEVVKQPDAVPAAAAAA